MDQGGGAGAGAGGCWCIVCSGGVAGGGGDLGVGMSEWKMEVGYIPCLPVVTLLVIAQPICCHRCGHPYWPLLHCCCCGWWWWWWWAGLLLPLQLVGVVGVCSHHHLMKVGWWWWWLPVVGVISN
jgi:hypothetical protein